MEAFDAHDKRLVHAIQAFGSLSRRTNNIESGDMDFLVIYNPSALPADQELMTSDALLAKTRQIVQNHFPDANVRRDGQAISLGLFGSTVDLVPALHDSVSLLNQDPVYRIPDGQGEWIRTCPDGINRYLSEANKKSGGQLRTTIRSVKLFTQRIASGVPLKSIYIELAVANTNATVGVKTKEQAIRDALVSLRNLRCKSLPDPTGVGDPIRAATTQPKQELATKQLENAAGWAERAVAARERGDDKEAGRLWSRVYGGGIVVPISA